MPDTNDNSQQFSDLNYLNAKTGYDAFLNLFLTGAQRSQQDYDELRAISRRALNNAVSNDHQATLASLRDQSLVTDDVLNPVTQGTGNAITGTTGVASNGVAATIPASANDALIATINNLSIQVAAFAQLVSNMQPSTAKTN